MPVESPSFELQASASALRHLTSDLSGWWVERTGSQVSGVWLRNANGEVWLISVEGRDVRPKFEVFTLGMLSISEWHERVERWEPPVLLDEVPDYIRQMLTTRPAAPVAPTHFDAWPLRSWRTEVVRRTEWIIEAPNVTPTVGNNPYLQSAASPRTGPPAEASAFCEVAAGVLFTGEDSKLLLAVDWMPLTMLVLQDEAAIDEFLAECELVSMSDYLNRRPA